MNPILITLLLPAAPLDATTRDFDQVHVDVNVTPRIAEGVIDGETTVHFSSLADPLKVLRLHCLDTTVLSVKDEGGHPLEYSLADGILSITLVSPLPRGGASAVVVAYRARPLQGMFFHAPTPESPSTPLEMYSQGEGTDNRRWFPCYDEPDDRCTVDVWCTVPTGLSTVSNGTLEGSEAVDGGLRRDHWKLDRPIPTYLVTLVAGKFDVETEKWKEVPLQYIGPRGRGAEVRTGCEFTPDMMGFFSEYTGRDYPWPRYAQVTVWDFVYGGMENASATTMNMRLLHGKETRPVYTADGLVAHELAHQWFGDLLTCRTWDHLWLNEGFATYFTDLYFEHRDGAEEFSLQRRGQNRGYMDGTREPEKLGLKPSPRGDVPLELFGGKQYSRGAAILHQLRIELGDEIFRAGIRAWVKEHADESVTSEQFRRSMEGAAGRSLAWFFDQWVYGAGYPNLKITREKDTLVVEQTQVGGGGQPAEFRITVPVRVRTKDGPVDLRLDVRRRRQVFNISAATGIRVGQGGGVFARIKLQQAGEAWAEALRADTDPTGRMDAAEALLEWPDFAAAPLAQALAQDASWAVRQECARSLSRIPGKTSLGALLAAVADADARVRQTVAEGLGGRDRDEATGALAKMAQEDGNPYVRSEAARSLGKVRAPGAFELLTGLLKIDSHRETIRQGALDGLRELGDPRAVDLARPLLRYDWPRGDHLGMREAAMRVLLAFAPDAPSTRAEIARLCADPHHRMREKAAGWAGDFRVPEAEAIVRKMAETESYGGVKAAAQRAVEQYGKPAPKFDD